MLDAEEGCRQSDAADLMIGLLDGVRRALRAMCPARSASLLDNGYPTTPPRSMVTEYLVTGTACVGRLAE